MSTLHSTFGREVEIGRLQTAIDARGQLVYVEGHAGIGKTSLLALARAHAEATGARVLSGAGSELERDYGYGVARQLLAEAATADATATAAPDGSAALAATALGLADAEPAPASPDSPFPVLDALYRLTAALAVERPLVLLLDDAHWADAPTLRLVDFLAGRLDGLPLTVVLAARPAEPEAPSELLERLRDRRETVLMRPAPLDERAAAALLRERWGRVPAAAFTAACREASSGNPFLLHELAGELLRDGVSPDDDGTAAVHDAGPESIARTLRQRLAPLPADCGALLDALAVLGPAAELRQVAAIAAVDPARAGELADLLADAGLLAAQRPLRFAHSIVRHAVHAALRPAARSTLHARAAATLTAEGRPAPEVAAHLLLCEPAGDDEVVATLRAVAADAVAQGAADVAQTHLRRALREPPSVTERGGLLAELGRAETLVGELEAAGEHLEEAAALAAGPVARAERLKAGAHTRLYRGDLAGAVALLEQARDDVDGIDREATLRLTAHAAAIGLLHPPTGAGALRRLRQLGDEPALDASPAGLAVLAELAGLCWLDGRIEAGAELAARALADERLLLAEGPNSIVVNHPLRVLVDADRARQARPHLEAALRAARRQGSVTGLASLLGIGHVAAWRAGDVRETEARGRELLELAPTPMAKLAHWAYLALALVERGELEEAEWAVERSGAGPALAPLTHVGVAFHARARLRLAQGRPRDALLDLLELRGRDEQLGVAHLSIPWHRTAVEAALAVGDDDAALTFADEQSARAERWSTASGRGLALSTQGLARGGEEGLVLLAEGAELLGSSPARLDHARALFDLGAALRRAGRPAQAREPLSASLDGARACGATVLAEQAHRELLVAGAKPRRLRFSGADALTAAERRVTGMAADGCSNREIAAALYVTVRTVENHLARSYRKLGISSRRELADALTAPRPASGG
ncbi:AAA family ATPase [Conexibacter stalactiti]|uniref:AAA family ATPase n=1 Tax=Conexibacter stalactiti TaxID=1940611 RepID=A0ABU4HKQ5_9ACTN|nr:AAA family ATPase [Conexibacter stalactiti]MDW5593890.1 AAA family ATPase [Conexibacter stalactiti]MEC5034532.1 AAA family ATPase [Conexibacter stalactiti]